MAGIGGRGATAAVVCDVNVKGRIVDGAVREGVVGANWRAG